VEQLHAKVDRTKKDGSGAYTQTPEAIVPVDQPYALMNKRKKKKEK
jgi:hypothetical protein